MNQKQANLNYSLGCTITKDSADQELPKSNNSSSASKNEQIC
jgi:hypothetical protein